MIYDCIINEGMRLMHFFINTEGGGGLYTGCSWKKTPLFRSRKKPPLFSRKKPPQKKIEISKSKKVLAIPWGVGWGSNDCLFDQYVRGEGSIFAVTHFAPCNRELRVRGDRITLFPLKPSLFAQNSSFPTLSTFISFFLTLSYPVFPIRNH